MSESDEVSCRSVLAIRLCVMVDRPFRYSPSSIPFDSAQRHDDDDDDYDDYDDDDDDDDENDEDGGNDDERLVCGHGDDDEGGGLNVDDRYLV